MRGTVIRRGKGWSYVVDIGPDDRGRRQQKWKSGFATKREADQALRKVLHALDGQRYVESSKLTLEAFVRDEWLPAIGPPNLRESTWRSYRAELEKHVLPRLGRVPLQQLNAIQLNNLYAQLRRDGRRDGRGGLSPRTVRYAHTVLRKALSDAVRWGLLERNVADLAQAPRQGDNADSHMRTWTFEQLGCFLAWVADDRLYAAWLLAAATGMRRGEVLGLRWVDVDLDAARLAVRQTLIVVENDMRISQPKTRRSRRTIDLDARTVAALRKWQRAQRAERAEWGPAWRDLGLVFTREDGSAINPQVWSKAFERHARLAGVPVIRVHDLRHTHASLLLAAGIHVKVVSERLGHHSVAFTLDVYAHVIPGMQAEAAGRLADLVLGPDDKQDQENDGDEHDQDRDEDDEEDNRS